MFERVITKALVQVMMRRKDYDERLPFSNTTKLNEMRCCMSIDDLQILCLLQRYEKIQELSKGCVSYKLGIYRVHAHTRRRTFVTTRPPDRAKTLKENEMPCVVEWWKL